MLAPVSAERRGTGERERERERRERNDKVSQLGKLFPFQKLGLNFAKSAVYSTFSRTRRRIPSLQIVKSFLQAYI